MTDPDIELSDNERELWTATLAQLREHAEDPRAEQGLDRLAEQILAEHRATAHEPELRVAGRRRSGRMIAGASLAAAATIAMIILATRPDDDAALKVERPEPREQGERELPIDPIPVPANRGPALDQVGLLTFGIGAVERTTEVASMVEPGAMIEPGATLSTEPEGETCVRWTAPFALVCVEGNARVELLAAESNVRRVRLHGGRLVAVLDPLAPGQIFEVTTSLGSVTAIGTVFVVDVGEVAIDASVFEGEVEIRDAQGARRLRADESLRLGDPGRVNELAVETRTRAEAVTARAELWRESLDRMGSVAWDSPQAVELDGHPLHGGELALLLTAGQHHLHLADADADAADFELDVTAGRREALGELGEHRERPAPVEQSAAELARLAQQARMARNYAETARIYRELIDRYPESPEATNVPIRLGDLLLKTGDHQEALEAYDRYLERGGQLEPEARFGRIKTLRALDRKQAELTAIAEFLREHPDDYRVAELEQRQAELE